MIPAIRSAQRTAEQVRWAAETGTVVPIAGTPFEATIPSQWHQTPAPNPSILFSAANERQDLGIWFSAIPVIDLPADLRSPQQALEAWVNGTTSSAQDCDASSFSDALLHGHNGLQCTLEGTFVDDTTAGSKFRLRLIRRSAVVADHLCEVTLFGVPSRVRALSEANLSELLETIRPVAQ
jgi:hypothetical protein